jgi:hypothetical protein
LLAAEARAAALTAGDAHTVLGLLHYEFTWTTHTGVRLDRTSYVRRNTDGTTRWIRQFLLDPRLVIVGETGVLTCTAVDEVEGPAGPETYRMPMTQVWTESSRGWVLLVGHAGPKIQEDT